MTTSKSSQERGSRASAQWSCLFLFSAHKMPRDAAEPVAPADPAGSPRLLVHLTVGERFRRLVHPVGGPSKHPEKGQTGHPRVLAECLQMFAQVRGCSDIITIIGALDYQVAR
ncbi:MAG: hypothetical protein JWM64_242 [Frankiales bacterium]|nr:hypothetical protein [Frankiales bacterium]